MSEIIGHVDALHRPIVLLPVPGRDDGCLVTVDTGFNRYLLIHETELSRIRHDLIDITMAVEFAGRERRRLKVGRGWIVWFGQPREVEILVTPAELPRAAVADEPVGLLGAALLSPHKLTVDFSARRVVIIEHRN